MRQQQLQGHQELHQGQTYAEALQELSWNLGAKRQQIENNGLLDQSSIQGQQISGGNKKKTANKENAWTGFSAKTSTGRDTQRLQDQWMNLSSSHTTSMNHRRRIFESEEISLESSEIIQQTSDLSMLSQEQVHMESFHADNGMATDELTEMSRRMDLMSIDEEDNDGLAPIPKIDLLSIIDKENDKDANCQNQQLLGLSNQHKNTDQKRPTSFYNNQFETHGSLKANCVFPVKTESVLREISNHVLGSRNNNGLAVDRQASTSTSSIISNSKQAKKNNRCCDRFIPSRVEADSYNLFLASQPNQRNHQSTSNSNNNNTQMNQSHHSNNSSIEEEEDRTHSGGLSAPGSSSSQQMPETWDQYRNLLQAHFNSQDLSPSYASYTQLNSSISNHCCSSSSSSSFGVSGKNHLSYPRKLFSYSNRFHQISDKQQSSGQCIPAGSNPSIDSFSDTSMLSSSNGADNESALRRISPKPYKILEAPALKNDFYLNLLDWSATNLVAVGLEHSVYVLSGGNQTVKTSFSIPEYIDPIVANYSMPERSLNDYLNNVCSVGWSQRNDHIAVGDKQGKLYLFDLHKNKSLRVMHNHSARIGQIAWNGNLIATGSRDRNILITDVRDKNPHSITFTGHKQEICGMRWSHDENTLASGGNDNKVFLWSLKTCGRLTKISTSKAAVKAIGFSPHQHNIMAFGGGTADRCIRLYDTQQLKQIECIDTGSQVCNLIFSKNSKQIISTHGYSLNQIIVWNQQNMKKIATLTGHSQRVLYLAESPCGQNILTGAADETIRFWNIFKSTIVNELSPSSLGLR